MVSEDIDIEGIDDAGKIKAEPNKGRREEDDRQGLSPVLRNGIEVPPVKRGGVYGEDSRSVRLAGARRELHLAGSIVEDWREGVGIAIALGQSGGCQCQKQRREAEEDVLHRGVRNANRCAKQMQNRQTRASGVLPS